MSTLSNVSKNCICRHKGYQTPRRRFLKTISSCSKYNILFTFMPIYRKAIRLSHYGRGFPGIHRYSSLSSHMCKNIVVVGDTLQLPNVVTDEDKVKLDTIFKQYNLNASYDCTHNCFCNPL